jgi:uracil DNA glycosylase
MSKSKEFWEKELNNWAVPLKELLISDYMQRVIDFLNVQSSMKNLIPERKDIFKFFRNCDYNNLNIIIIIPSIASVKNFTRIMSNDGMFDHEFGPLNFLFNQIEKEYHNGLLLDFDKDLKHWGEQGILVLPLALTQSASKENHSPQWNKFSNTIIEMFDTESSNIVFLQWGTNIQIKNCTSLNFKSPEESFNSNKEWKFPFKKVDKMLKELKNIEIKW